MYDVDSMWFSGRLCETCGDADGHDGGCGKPQTNEARAAVNAYECLRSVFEGAEPHVLVERRGLGFKEDVSMYKVGCTWPDGSQAALVDMSIAGALGRFLIGQLAGPDQ